MRTLIFLLFMTLLIENVKAKAPECPLYPDRKSCLASVEEYYRNSIQFIEEEFEEPEALLQAAADVRHFESLACEKTCLN